MTWVVRQLMLLSTFGALDMHEKKNPYLLDDMICKETLVAACHPLFSAL